MKILIICNNLYPAMGGPFRAITETYKSISSNTKYKCRLAYKSNGKTKRKLDLIFLLKNFDVIHYFGGWDFFHVKVMLLSLIFKKKIILTPMGIFEKWSLDQKKIKKILALNIYQKFLLNKANIIHVTSALEKENLRQITNNQNIKLIPHGLGSLNLKPKKFFQGAKKKAIFFSRLHDKKGIIELVEAWLNISNNEWELHIFGPDNDQNKQKIINKINNDKSIFIFEPIFTEKKNIFIEYDLFILPSKSENFGYAILESMQLGLPVLTTNKTPWYFLEKQNAGWITDASLTELEDKLKKIFSTKKEEFEKKSDNAINLAKGYYWENLKYKYFSLYEELN